MPDDRDKLRVKTPPAGVRALIAKPETWDNELTPTPVSASALEAVSLRTKRSITIGQTTLDRVGNVRNELKNDIAKLDARLEAQAEHVGNLRETTAKMNGQLDLIVSTLQEDREERRQHSMIKVTAEVEVDKASALAETEIVKKRALTEISEQAARRKFYRQVALKILAGAGVIWAAISTTALANLHC